MKFAKLEKKRKEEFEKTKFKNQKKFSEKLLRMRGAEINYEIIK
jgi:hypothetical protein